MSGPAAPWGIQFEQGFDWAVDKVNTRGGIKVGDDIYMIKTVKGNSKMIDSVAAIEASRMVCEENIHYIVGPITTHQAEEPILRETKRFMACPSTDLPIGPDHPYNIMTAASSSNFLGSASTQ